jgi:hypothetical protein
VENGEISDSGYQSLDWMPEPLSEPSQDHNVTADDVDQGTKRLDTTFDDIQPLDLQCFNDFAEITYGDI